MRHCKKSSPKLAAVNIDVSSDPVILNVCGVFPSCGCFDVCIKGCSNTICSGTPVTLCDSEGTYLYTRNCKGDDLTLGQVSAQALRQGVLHFRRSSDYPTIATMRDKLVCSPTPIINSSGAVVVADEPVATTSTKK